ncbi:pilus assembly protein [Paenibacillus rhizovicinus]|uniref:Pilus assembly protein n=1 Tax=Paenibacillus rhizovicinus TaxID=2704463 RepID=A0A6C0P4N4_9BACL|nr:TadE family protein [Paenibacillus rhizovicinus]QHW33216.1 pilus assembly protein [Paenibacillus rhizovicinus]
MRANRWLAELAKREDGNFTLEASMVFPVLFLILIALLMFSMYAYQNVVLYHTASLTSERTAFRWDNSSRDPLSGIAPTGEYDGLYWRLADNGALKTLFGFGSEQGGGEGIEIAVGASMSVDRGSAAGNSGDGAGDAGEGDSGGDGGRDIGGDGTSLPVRKMKAEAARVGGPFEGTMHYSGTLEKRIGLKLRQPISIHPLEMLLGHSSPVTAGSASIVDPVELIRNVELVRYYTGKFKGGMDNDKRNQAQKILGGRKALSP